MDRLFSIKITELEKIGFDIVHGCQLQCVGCPNSTLLPSISFISLEDFAVCLANIDVKRVELLRLFNYGEPFLHPGLADIVRLIPQQRWSVDFVEISTNGQVHDFEKVKEILKTGVLGRLVVSCDGNGTPEEYERLRPPAQWPKLVEFLSRVKELRDVYAPEVELMTRTICETDQGRRNWSDLLAPRGWVPEFRGWLHLPGMRRKQTEETPVVSDGVCWYMAGARHLHVDADGAVVPCCVHPRAHVLGNLRLSKYNDILRSELHRQFVRILETDRQYHPVCGACSLREDGTGLLIDYKSTEGRTRKHLRELLRDAVRNSIAVLLPSFLYTKLLRVMRKLKIVSSFIL